MGCVLNKDFIFFGGGGVLIDIRDFYLCVFYNNFLVEGSKGLVLGVSFIYVGKVCWERGVFFSLFECIVWVNGGFDFGVYIWWRRMNNVSIW